MYISLYSKYVPIPFLVRQVGRGRVVLGVRWLFIQLHFLKRNFLAAKICKLLHFDPYSIYIYILLEDRIIYFKN